MTYQDAIEYLYGLQMFGMKLGLENTRWLAGQLGQPQDRLRFIHVAGTNGKGSVCAMIESMYRQGGLRVGLFTSPHLVSFTERIQINRVPISEANVVRWVEKLRDVVAGAPQAPTFFEVVTVMALGCFAEQECDLVVWETGLGGRLDATNIVNPLASVITNIDWDHQQWLGNTLEQIAVEKAGIIKPGRPVVTGATTGRGLEEIAAAARELKCPLTWVGGSRADSGETSGIQHLTGTAAWDRATHGRAGTMPDLAMTGRHQRVNAAVALATVATIDREILLEPAAIRRALETVTWPGRMQLVPFGDGKKVLLDGAHNTGSALALRESMADAFPDIRPTLILGLLSDKDWLPMVVTLVPLASRVVAVPVHSKRTVTPEALAAACRTAMPTVPVMAMPSLDAALHEVAGDSFVLITGSLYLVGEALERLRVLPVPPADERQLNEWSAPGNPAVAPSGHPMTK